ncbi:MAG: Clp protease ClpP [Selenomonadaceae bacterium]|nr:Clp protease ClpP [Selenomonadaceae bacterium]
MLTIKNETSTCADLYINGTIIDDEEGSFRAEWFENTDGWQWPKDLKRQLDNLRGKELNIYMNSYGGSVPAGLAMAHMIERHDGKTTAIVDGYCCSIATQIFFAADTCRMYPNSYLMIHKPFSALVGNADEMRKVAEILDTLQVGLETAYQKKALDGVTAEEIHGMVEDETWLTGTEAAAKFQIELQKSLPVMNCVGSVEKLTAMGAKKIPAQLKFKAETRQTDITEIEIALARAKGVV